MPYQVAKRGTKFAVEKQDGSRAFGTHDTREEADRQLAALHASERRVAETRSLHLLDALGAVRSVVEGAIEYLVVPVVALMEGVIHAVNAETPEFVPLSTLEKAAATWNGRPVTLGHPRRDGKQCSAQDPAIIESHGIGTIRNSRVDGKKLLCEAWVEKARAKKLHPDMYARLADGGTEEVSVGALVVTDKVPGKYNEKPFTASWVGADGDHLAFLPGGRGACSVEMGCGTHRAAMRIGEDAMQLECEKETKGSEVRRAPACLVFTTLEDQTLDKRIAAVQDAVSAEWNDPPVPPEPYAYATQVFDDFAIVCKGEETWKVSYDVDANGAVTLGKPVAVKQAWVAASNAEEIAVLAGARHSAKDMTAIQAVHDHSMALGATCDRANYKMLASKIASDDLKLKRSKLSDPTHFYIDSVRAERVNHHG